MVVDDWKDLNKTANMRLQERENELERRKG